MFDNRLVVLVTVTLLLLLASSAGCTLPGTSQSHVQTYVNSIHDSLSSVTDLQLNSWQQTQEDSNTIRLRYDIHNSTDSMTTTMDIRVKEFPSISDTTKK
jgi:hypothetical protein